MAVWHGMDWAYEDVCYGVWRKVVLNIISIWYGDAVKLWALSQRAITFSSHRIYELFYI